MSEEEDRKGWRDNWLHIACDALSKYVANGGGLLIGPDEQSGDIVIMLVNVELTDARLPKSFVELV